MSLSTQEFKSLQAWNDRFDQEIGLVGETLASPGYHTRIPDGVRVHSTRTNLNYALLLLRAGGIENDVRGAIVIERVIALQDANPVSRTYGIWPWFIEEPLSEMAPPDWNWADFCGAALGQALVEHGQQLAPDLQDRMRAALGNAAWAIFRRNIGPDYTNIAVMGAGVCALAGELLTEPRLLDYGRRRLARFLEHTRFHGGFNEYNSPTYTLVALFELERILQLVRDPAMRADAEMLRCMTWEGIAEHFHPSTGQWAGPHSRAYMDRLEQGGVHYLSEMTGVAIKPHPNAGDFNEIHLVRSLACPQELRERFKNLHAPEVEIIRPFIRRPDGSVYVQGTTWLGQDVCLGSANIDSLWTQRRPLIAYWRTGDDPAVVLRMRFLKDGRDFASLYVVNAQKRQRVLSAVGVAERMGDFHLFLDSPVEGVFKASDLRLRYELSGVGVDAVEQEDTFELSAGDWRAVIHPAVGRFDGQAVRWRCGKADGQAWVDAVCYEGAERAFRLKECGDAILAAGLEVLGREENVTSKGPELRIAGSILEASWQDLRVELQMGLAPPPVDYSIYKG
jgi:hypothetical protein